MVQVLASVQKWLERLGYAEEPSALHRPDGAVSGTHSYAREIKTLLDPHGRIRAKAVFDVEGVPSVAFVSGDDGKALSEDALNEIRKSIWNQNLVNIVVDLSGDTARVVPSRKTREAPQSLTYGSARQDGPFSALDIASSNLSRRFPNWFDIKARVDSKLLSNLAETVRLLAEDGFNGRAGPVRQRQRAELLMGQILFLSYLEHRDIVGSTYRQARRVGQLHDLVVKEDHEGVRHLIDCLRLDFNGDFLGDDRHDPWQVLTSNGFRLLDAFLNRTDMKTGQADFWNYDFSFIPVELLSGLYESFLSPDEQAKAGAYYTPRHLAMLTVEQAFLHSKDPLLETIFDGACGSGILLTTAYRRLIALKEQQLKRTLTFKERGDLLVRQIFGADINPMACRVSAFSLYLSLLEGLDPADIMEAQKLERAKLPNLAGQNLLHGANGDFFRDDHAFAKRKFSMFICNPPWAEPAGQSVTSADKWSKRSGIPIARRQIAGAFALRALDFLRDGGRLCLILPITQFLGPTSNKFVASLFGAVRPERLINFGDLQNLLFPSAEHTCHVFLGYKRGSDLQTISPVETFDYCVPKADMSLAYGRLTMQSADKHLLQTVAVAEDPQLLVTLMWGNAIDVALITRLSAFGQLGDLCGRSRRSGKWVARKGVHMQDSSRTAVSAAPLKRMKFVPVAALSAGSPVLHDSLLTAWPIANSTVAGLDDDLLSVFDGPRVLFPDGFSREEPSVRAAYYDRPATFSHSIGVIAGDKNSAQLLKFLAAFLRSRLAKYFLMMKSWKMLCERNAMHLSDIESFPFFDPKSAPNPGKAKEALREVNTAIDAISRKSELEQAAAFDDLRDKIDESIFDFFDVKAEERDLVRETVDVFMPAIRPRSYASLNTLLQQPASKVNLRAYTRALGQALTDWRKRTKGRGRFIVSVVASDPKREGAVGVVRIEFDSSSTAAPHSAITVDDTTALETLASVRRHGLTVIPSGKALQLVPDTHIWLEGAVYLVRPLTLRSWTQRQAIEDAERIVRDVQRGMRNLPKAEAS